LNLRLAITGPEGISTVVKISFYEMPLLEKERLIFVNASEKTCLMWNGRSWSTPYEGEPPLWKTLHVIVPPMERLLTNDWHDVPVCMHEWGVKVD